MSHEHSHADDHEHVHNHDGGLDHEHEHGHDSAEAHEHTHAAQMRTTTAITVNMRTNMNTFTCRRRNTQPLCEPPKTNT